MNPFFQSINDANRVQCARLGLSADELYGASPTVEEFAVHKMIKAGVPAEAAEPVFRASKAKHLKHWPRTPIQRLGYIEARIKQGCSPLPEGGAA